jgi:hypothetical protein
MALLPMKLHYLESQLWMQMAFLRTISFADEGGIERLHHWWNIVARLYAPMRNWALLSTAVVRRLAMESFGPVMNYLKGVLEKV